MDIVERMASTMDPWDQLYAFRLTRSEETQKKGLGKSVNGRSSWYPTEREDIWLVTFRPATNPAGRLWVMLWLEALGVPRMPSTCSLESPRLRSRIRSGASFSMRLSRSLFR